jgi:hypothetical protein
MRRLVGLIALIAAVPFLWAEEPKEYPLTLVVLETDAISSKADGTRTTTTCRTSTSVDEITCDSQQVAGAVRTELVSYATASDGKAYLISCAQNSGARFAQGFAAGTGASTVTGCRVPPGTYKARWDKGRLRVLHEKNGKAKETTFVVLSSVAMPTQKTTPMEDVSNAEKTVLKVSSIPAGADIGLDGNFVGQTPSSLLALPGDHHIRISKAGYKPWERTIRTSGGEATVVAELDAEH